MQSTASEAQLIEEAERLSAVFRERADEVEQARRVPKALSQMMAEAGFYRMFIPEALGGLETSPATASRVFETLAQGDASCAWVAFIGATSGTGLSGIPAATAREVFATPDTMLTGVFAPNGLAEAVEGGFNVNGRWQWGSGSENAAWVMGGCMLKADGEAMLDERGNPRQHMMIFRAEDVEFLDTWHVSGLRGTGSMDFQVTDVFVPEDRAVGYLGSEIERVPLLQFPNFTLLALGVAAVALGTARDAIDELVQLAQSKRRISNRNTLSERTHSHLQVAEAEARLRSARAFYYDTIEVGWQAAVAGEKVSVEARRDIRLATNNAVTSSVAAVDSMYTLAGGASVYETSRLQRQLRDVHVATQHIMVGPNILEQVGRLYMGVDANTATL